MSVFSVDSIAFTVMGYGVSWIELVGTVFGLISVVLAARAHILTWGAGIVNECCLFLLFYQVQLYPDMFLQVFFFGVTVYGWVQWNRPERERRIAWLTPRWRWILSGTLISGTALSWWFFSRIDVFLPMWFSEPTAFPLADSFVMVASVVATALLAMKKMETWWVWMGVDAVCIFLYLSRGVYFLSLEYLIFLGLATYGLFNWMRKHQG